MKSNFYSFQSVLTIVIFTAIFFSCKTTPNNSSQPAEQEKNSQKRFDDINGAIEYEFNMIKNPATGKIPEGIRQMEMAQAREISQSQSPNAPTLLNAYTFQGPDNLGGRTRSIAYDVRFNGAGNQIILAGGVSGGIYKSIDNGATWVRKSPTGQHFSVTSVAQDPRIGFQDTWYYTTGEALGNSASEAGAFYLGNGTYKSTDNGETWVRLANSNTGVLEAFDRREDCITKIIVDPTNGNVYMAAIDGIYRSTNGGTNWSNILTSGFGSIGTDMVTDIAVTSTGRFYAAFSGTNNTAPTDMPGVWTSITGASGSWTRIAGPGGTPVGWNANSAYGRVVLAIAPSNENLVYVLYWNGVENLTCTPAGSPEAELFLWDQSITTWVDRTANLPNQSGCLVGNDPFAVQGGYDLVMSVKPDNANVVFIGGTNIYRSTDGFATTGNTTRIGGYNSPASYALYLNSHSDIHAIAFQPGSTITMLCGNDGGIQRTTNNLAATVAWTPINSGYRTYQYYYVALDPRSGNTKVIGGAQDNGTTRNTGGAGINFEQVYSGDGVSVGLSDLISGNTFEYCGSQLGDIERRNSTSGLGITTDITPSTASSTGLFITLFKLDPDNTQNLYYADNNSLYRTASASTVTSATWTNMTGIATAVAGANDISALATTRGTYSAATASLFIGTSNAKLFRLNDPINAVAATAPVDISGAAFPAGAYVSSVAVNPRNDDTVLVTFSNYGVTSVFWTGNANAATPTWINVEDNLTLPSYRSSAIVLKGNTVEYYVGTSAGLYGATIDALNPANTNWAQEGAAEIGNAVVTSLALRPADNRLAIGTHGYGMWTATVTNPLPVTLLNFSGNLKGNNILLDWSTANEINSKEFEIEKSVDGINYRKISSVAAAGNTASTNSYNYLDREATEINYYRLKMIDLNGTSKISNTVVIKNTGLVQNIAAISNPFKDYINIRFTKMPKGKVVLSLTDLSGKRLGVNEYYQPASAILRFDNYNKNLVKGIYILQAVADGKRYSIKVMKD
jgi:hypothetical protein